MKTISDPSSAKDVSGQNEQRDQRREDCVLTVKLGLLAFAIFGTVILLATWQ